MNKEDLEKLSTDELKKLLEEKQYEVAGCSVMQQGIKVTLNSAYGMIGNEYSRYYDVRMAEGITVSGKLSIRWIERKLNEYLNKFLKTDNLNFVVAGDTDSVYLSLKMLVDKFVGDKPAEDIVKILDRFCEDKLQPHITNSYDELAKYMNAPDQQMFMAREVIADRGLWRAKKNYILNVHNSEGVQYEEPELKVKGIECVRSSTPEICRDAIKETLKILMKGDEKVTQKHIAKFKKFFMNSSIEDISFPRGVSDIDKWYVEDDQDFKLKTPIHVKAALTYNRLIRKYGLENEYRLIQNGDKLKFLYLYKQNPTFNNAIAFPDIMPPEFKLDKCIDRLLQYNKAFKDPIASVLDVVGWSPEHRATLEGLF